MRRMLLALGAIGLAAPVLVPAHPALSVVPPVADVSLSAQGLPKAVSSAGGFLHEITVTNKGLLLMTGVEVLTETSNASVKDVTVKTLSVAGGSCTPDPPSTTRTCTFVALLPGEKATIQIAAAHDGGQAPTTSASLKDALPPDDIDENNRASVTTPLNDSSRASALVFPGGSLTYLKHVFRVPEGSADNGVIASLSAPTLPAGTTCGSRACGEAVLLDFDPHEDFQAERIDNSLTLDASFGQVAPCKGLGTDKCIPLYWADRVGDPMKLVENCPGAGSPNSPGTGFAIPDPCVNFTYKSQGEIHYDIRLTSKDPLFSIPRL